MRAVAGERVGRVHEHALGDHGILDVEPTTRE
jgi:hypothetical protein